MAKKRRGCLFTIGLLVVIIIAVPVVAYFTINQIVQAGAREGMTYAFQVPCQVADADVDITGGGLTLGKVAIANPEEFKEGSAVAMEEIRVRANLKSFMSDQMIIHEIELRDPVIRLEQKLTGSNLTALLDNLEETLAKLPKKEEVEEKEAKDLLVEKVRIEGARLRITTPIPGAPDAPLALPTIDLENLEFSGESTAVTIAKLSRVIFMKIIESVLTAGGDVLPDEVLKGLGTGLQGVEEVLQGVEGMGKDAGGAAIETLKGFIPGGRKEEE